MDEKTALTFIQEREASCFFPRALDQLVSYRSNAMKVGENSSLILEPLYFSWYNDGLLNEKLTKACICFRVLTAKANSLSQTLCLSEPVTIRIYVDCTNV